MDQDHIDDLLEQYLLLLHEYTSLREELTTLQTGIYQNIARANFAAERGLRFGQDYYDDRMQASSRLAITQKGQDQDQDQDQDQGRDRRNPPAIRGGIVPSFTTINHPASVSIAEDSESHDPHPHPHPHPSAGPHPEEAEAEADSVEPSAAKSPTTSPQVQVYVDAQSGKDTDLSPPTPTPTPTEARGGGKAAPQQQQRPNDPLRWFGLLTPAPLRHAQTQGLRAVEHVIPRLASISAEMAAVEIEVRRARKRRAKAEAAAGRLSQHGGQERQGTPGMQAVAASDACT
ncbi:hypothetical protein F5Y14DRAFT_98657 [Nemania sp. NC0429]|nr:hypothetical protein F5Y14DRAFT_98657 [Nemania sp. NC0429]